MIESLNLPLIWAGLLALAVFMYIFLDGFDLGLGILFPFAPTDRDRDMMMASVAPVWDGNETWLVLGGGGLFAVFPKGYGALLPAVYMPIGFMLVALIFRGVAFEFRFKSKGSLKRVWDQAFHWGSVVAAFSQGLILGTMVQGINIDNGRFVGSMFDWMSPFSFFTGCAVVWGYTMLGATWLIIKTENDLLSWSRTLAQISLGAVIICMIIVSFWVPLLDVTVSTRWGISYPDIDWFRLLLLSPIPILTALVAVLMFRSIRIPDTLYAPFVYAVLLFLFAYIGLIISLFPYLVPYSLTIYEAAAAPNSQALLLAGAVVLIPTILAYTFYVYWVFRGKVDLDAGYKH